MYNGESRRQLGVVVFCLLYWLIRAHTSFPPNFVEAMDVALVKTVGRVSKASAAEESLCDPSCCFSVYDSILCKCAS